MNRKFHNERIPYWDADHALRVPEICNISGDGLHVKMWVDLMRAKMLFNLLCDDDMQWRGSAEMFK